MTKSTLKSTLVAATVALSFLAAPAAYAQTAPSRDTGVGLMIAAQGNAALRLIRTEFKAAAEKAFKPSLPARKKRVSTPAAAAGGSIAVTAPCAE